MREVHLFCEDTGHESFLRALLLRLRREFGLGVSVKPFNVVGGHGRMLKEFGFYIRDLREGWIGLPDLIVVVRDANCRGLSTTRTEIMEIVQEYDSFVVCAIPDPHVERWLLLDSSAFKKVLGQGCNAPDQKCEKERYKQLLIQAILEAGLRPLARGIEHAEDIVNAMDLERMVTADPSLGSLITEVRRTFSSWSRQD